MSAKPCILIDDAIPYIKGVLEPRARVRYLRGGEIGPADLRGVDALLVRTRTRCDARLFALHRPAFVGTATIGTDHIDLDYCARHGMAVASAPGCNAWGVVQYVLTALCWWEAHGGPALAGKTLGIVGVGAVGARLSRLAPQLGLKVLCNDPPRAAAEGPQGFTPLAELLAQSDVVSLHVPLTSQTRGMVHNAFFEALRPGAGFINSSRGEVVEEAALLGARQRLGFVALDVWPQEPAISPALLEAATLATPHIAGYSVEGKLRGTQLVVQALARHFGWEELYGFVPRAEASQGAGPLTTDPLTTDPLTTDPGSKSSALLKLFPIGDLDRRLRQRPGDFERIRAEYPYRHDVSGCRPLLFDLDFGDSPGIR